ncbi:hypothetical protein, partial [uncultured Methanofollis sp.]|uniref:hypothetical protein n=1 Tax=uncultured Methanofollis sp. TaxID=262500 RepID=UPI002630597C
MFTSAISKNSKRRYISLKFTAQAVRGVMKTGSAVLGIQPKQETPRPGFEPGSKAPEAFRI